MKLDKKLDRENGLGIGLKLDKEIGHEIGHQIGHQNGQEFFSIRFPRYWSMEQAPLFLINGTSRPRGTQ